jgi:hypothetical protein
MHADRIGAGAGRGMDIVPHGVTSLESAVVLHEDKKYYPEAQEVYPAGTETLVEDEDTQPLSKPIIAPIEMRQFSALEKEVPETTVCAVSRCLEGGLNRCRATFQPAPPCTLSRSLDHLIAYTHCPTLAAQCLDSLALPSAPARCSTLRSSSQR